MYNIAIMIIVIVIIIVMISVIIITVIIIFVKTIIIMVSSSRVKNTPREKNPGKKKTTDSFLVEGGLGMWEKILCLFGSKEKPLLTTFGIKGAFYQY